jgi:hypothetical protein
LCRRRLLWLRRLRLLLWLGHRPVFTAAVATAAPRRLRCRLLVPDGQQLSAVRQDAFDDGLRSAVAVVLGTAATTARRIARGAAVFGEQLRHRALRTI